jgi:hypothetical protein
MTHPATRHLQQARESLAAAITRFNEGPDAYNAERKWTQEALSLLDTIIADVAFVDAAHDPDVIADQAAWDRQTRPTLGKPVVGGL